MRQTQAEQREAQRQAIRAQIRNCENTIDDLNQEIGRINQKLERQQEAKKHYDNMCIQVESAKERKRGNTRNMELYVKNVKFLYGYQSRMYEFLDGQRATGSRRSMEEVAEKMTTAINDNIQRLEELRRQIADYHSKIAQLNRKLGGI